jgi:hypothetical protein
MMLGKKVEKQKVEILKMVERTKRSNCKMSKLLSIEKQKVERKNVEKENIENQKIENQRNNIIYNKNITKIIIIYYK